MRIVERELLLKEDGTAYLEEVSSRNFPDVSKITSAIDIHRIMVKAFNLDKKAEEHVYMIAVNNKNQPISYFEISHGNVNSSIMDTRGILIKALYSNATGIFLVHNHPSGNPEPSRDDIQCTKRIKEACNLVGINLIDHIIIGNKYFCSLKEMQMF